MDSKIPYNEIKKLKSSLRYGHMGRIADMSNCGVSSVRRFFRGELYSDFILENTLKLLENRSNTISKLKKYLSKNRKKCVQNPFSIYT
jgi:hypothetical protein